MERMEIPRPDWFVFLSLLCMGSNVAQLEAAYTWTGHIFPLRFLSSSSLSSSSSSTLFTVSREARTEKTLATFTDPTSIFSVLGPKMVAQDFTVDLSKPLVFQVGHLGEDYQEWVHQPIVSKEGPRFFDSDFWEALTRTKWWAIPLIWLPVVTWSISRSVRMGLELPRLVLMMAIGIFVWTLMEYSLHRFLFHIKTKTYWGNTIHYLLHGCHHKHPMDGLRLVFPPAGAAVICVPLWNLIKFLSTPTTAPALFGGGLLGYVMYDVTHYYLHHGQPSSKVPRNLKKYHLNHHFRIQDMGFGITSSLWDRVFGTLPPSKAPGKSR